MSGNNRQAAAAAAFKLRNLWAEKGLRSLIAEKVSPVPLAQVLLEDANYDDAHAIRKHLLDIAVGPALAPSVLQAIEECSVLPHIDDSKMRAALEKAHSGRDDPGDWAQLLHAAAPGAVGGDRNPFFRYREKTLAGLVSLAQSMGY